ncbi:OTU domain-containing protein 5, partial [Geodia barretti]
MATIPGTMSTAVAENRPRSSPSSPSTHLTTLPLSSHPSPPSGGPPPPTRDRGGDSEPGTPPYYSGYNSAEEYEATHAPFFDLELERQFEQALKKSRGMVIHRMKPDGACLFRAVADQVYGDQDMHSVVRNHTMDY